MRDVALHRQARAAIDVDAVGAAIGAVRRVLVRIDVVHRVARDQPVARLIVSGIRRFALKPDRVDADIVVIVDDVVRDAKAVDVAVHHQRFAGTEFQRVDFIAVDDDVRQALRRARAVHRDAVRIAAIPAGEVRLDVMDFVVENLDIVARAGDEDAHRHVVLLVRSCSCEFRNL